MPVSPQDHLPFIIIGAGIGGLTAALSLARAGYRLEVIEQATELSEVGAGLQLSPNAKRVLDRLGLGTTLQSIASQPDALHIYNALAGTTLATMPLGEKARQRWGAPYLVAHRADVQRILYEACLQQNNIRFHFGTMLQHVNQNSSLHIETAMQNETKVFSARALIGADGLWSNVRAKLLNDGAPQPTGYVAYRAVVPTRLMPSSLQGNASAIWMGPHLHVVHYPLRDSTITNIVAIIREEMTSTSWGDDVTPHALLKAAASCAPILNDILRAPKNWMRWALYARASNQKRWPRGNITLLGDAAHPMLPFLAQGAAQAIEDAAVLTQFVNEHDTIADAFSAYRAERAQRIAKITREAECNGQIFHLRGLPALARDTALKFMSAERLMRRYDWLYGASAS